MTFSFGVFDLSPESGELRKHGIPIKLSPQPFQALIILIEHAGEVVSRDQLRELLWGQDDISVEFDAGMNRCIRQIRAALSDNAESSRYIETVPRKGYRFIAPVEIRGRDDVIQPIVLSLSEPPLPAPTTKPGNNWRRTWTVAAVIALIAVGSLIAVMKIRSRRSHLSADLNVVPLAVALGDQYSPTFSPDGRQVAFAWNGEDQANFDIYLKLIGSPSPPLRLTTDKEMDYGPAWSPDGRWIAFCRGSDSPGGSIWIIPSLGGSERRVIGLKSTGLPGNRLISWLPDSKSLVVAGLAGSGLSLVNVETASIRQLTSSAADQVDMFPNVSPDGRTVAFTRDTGRGVSSILLLAFSGDAQPYQLASLLVGDEFRSVFNARPVWTPDGSSIVFQSRARGKQYLWIAPAREAEPARNLAALGDGAQAAAIAGTGHLAFVRESIDSNIWRIDLGGLSGVPALTPTQVITSTRAEESPAVSPNGKRIAFASDRSGYGEIWVCDADGSNPMPVTSMQNPVTGSPDWSPDGRSIVFDSRIGGQPQIYVVGTQGGKPENRPQGKTVSVVPRWSPDGRSIYYSSDQTGRMEIWSMPSAGGAPQQVTHEGGFAPVVSRDGKFLYYSSSNAPFSSLWELSFADGHRNRLSSTVVKRAYSPAPGGVVFFEGSTNEKRNRLFFFERESGTKRILFQSEKPVGSGIALAPDGHTLYYTQIDQRGHELLLVSNFWKN